MPSLRDRATYLPAVRYEPKLANVVKGHYNQLTCMIENIELVDGFVHEVEGAEGLTITRISCSH